MNVFSEMSGAQFENVNSLRTYPFAGSASLADRLGRELGRDVIVDVHLCVVSGQDAPASGFAPSDGPVARLASVHLSGAMVSACFTSSFGGRKDSLSVTVSRDGFAPYVPYRLESLCGSADTGGVVTFGDFAFPEAPETYFFGNAVVHPCCVSCARPPALRRIVDPRSGDSVSGDVSIGFSGHVSSAYENGAFRLSLEEGSAEYLASACAKISGDDACGATPIASINGVRPDEDGNIVLWFH